MSATIIGRVKAPSGKSYEVKRDSTSMEVYIAVAGWTVIGKANSVSKAITNAEGYVYNR